MAVPEPEAGFGLWPRVRAITGWPESNEDTLEQLSAGWQRGASAFESAGGHDLTAVRQSWGDRAGGAFLTRAGKTLATATEQGTGMAALSRQVTAFGAEVAGVKNSIRSTIGSNDPVYGLIGALLPPPFGGAAQAVFAQQTAEIVNATIAGAAARVSGQGGPAAAFQSTGNDAKPGIDPKQNAEWWRKLSPEEQLRLIREQPELIAGLDGLPTAARDDANRLLLERTPEDLRAQARRLREEATRLDGGIVPQSGEGIGGADPVNRAGLLAEADRLDQRAKHLEELSGRLGPNTPYDPKNPTAGDQRYFLLGFDNTDDGRAIVSRGNPDTATDVATLVPGISHNISTLATPSAPGEQTIIDRLDVLHKSATDAGSRSTAVIGWLGYDSPDGADAPNTAASHAADAAKDDLAGFQQGLRESHVGPRSHNTVIGHSYGALVAGIATRDRVLDVDDFVSVGSLGNGTHEASQHQVGNVWVAEDSTDWIADTGLYVRDPDEAGYRGRRLQIDSPPEVRFRTDPHSRVFEATPGNVGLGNLGRVIAGQPPVG
ncbi:MULTISPECIES: alpha/beta hydrolase [unclassified Crossiella]|uniref:alpha/beta hydrolase n=1 Tax=unclassified Crossiella TaxID=2620835 RepID=UPI0020003214|nr:MULTISPECIES: alpha/beta hydrolase [unclassified Crossiella]MCK2243515.1 alpha/beta hydrolase family protein [Crossiella sp. S99.2]MCK2257373.1 alpha/beta hydrolase family protein [Crossiella sp. S99.1]